MALRTLLLASSIAACCSLTVYNPPNAGVALDAVEKALGNIINSPHLSKEQLTQAKKVATDVEKTVEYLATPEGMKLSKAARGAKVTASIAELQGLQTEWMKAAGSSHKSDLMKQLMDKKAELAKDQKMLKVINLEKALAEKKLALQKLIDMKQGEKSKKEQQDAAKEAEAQQEMVANVLKVAKTLKGAKPAESDQLKSALTYLDGRIKTVKDSIAKLDAEDKKHEDELKETVDKKMPVKDASDPLAKSQGIIKMLMKKEHRQYEKARAGLNNELKELNQAVASIKKGDVSGLTKVMGHMQSEMKSLQAKSHKFLY